MRVTSLVLKVASRCNLNCTYCYMYNLGDETYKQQPKFMGQHVVDALLQKVKSHIIDNQVERFSFVFHGGEPMLAPKDWYRYFIPEARRILKDSGAELIFTIQTNGVLVDDEWCLLFKELGMYLGFSMDGTRKAHDQFRLDHAGRGSYDQVVKGMQTYKKHFGHLAVITVFNFDENPIAIYENLKTLGVTSYNILLQDCHYDLFPEYFGFDYDASKTPVADVLIPLFEHWFNDKDPNRPEIIMFQNLINIMLGRPTSGNELYGSLENSVLVIETNGAIEAVDVLKICGHGFTKDDINIKTHRIEDALETPLAQLYYDSHQALCQKCQVCPLEEVCGGGYLPHRYSKSNGFNNPSVYCGDLTKIIVHLQNRVFQLFPDQTLEEAEVHLLDLEEVEAIIQKGLLDAPSNGNAFSHLEKFAHAL